ncbi:PaaI family thioesterase [Streptomyces sp. NPDC056161]|uniref:PaaI family thioesterase n=1 Tax=Streptomyces sp. NPDC056161 TaxID=3345732 RepID=UPI0035E0D05F
MGGLVNPGTAPSGVDTAELEARIRRSPFHTWLGLRVLTADASQLRLRASWREEWSNGNSLRTTHGGIVAALLDLAADWAIACAGGQTAPTLDFSVQYLRAAQPGHLTVVGRVLKQGRSVTFAEAEVLDADGRTLAVGRGTYASFTRTAG